MKQGPDFIIIGAMKCATSTLHAQLAEQPGIFMTEPKEPNFFSNDEIWNFGLDWYEALYGDAGEGDLRGESSTHYSKLPTYPHTVQRIAKHVNSTAKFVYIMRHPIDRLISHYMHGWLEQSFQGSLDSTVALHPELVQYSLYAKQLKPFIEEFGLTRILPVFFDRLRMYPQEELERISQFIGYKGSAVWKTTLEKQNISGKRLRPTPLLNLLKNIPGSETLRRNIIPVSVREKIKNFWRMNERPSLSDENLHRLTETFDGDLTNLSAWLGMDINCRNFKSVTKEAVPSWRASQP